MYIDGYQAKQLGWTDRQRDHNDKLEAEKKKNPLNLLWEKDLQTAWRDGFVVEDWLIYEIPKSISPKNERDKMKGEKQDIYLTLPNEDREEGMMIRERYPCSSLVTTHHRP